MVRIRLRRVGSRKNPIWRVVVADQRSPRDGRTIETIGHYNPQTDPSVIVIDEERARHWLEHGAQPTRTVATLLRTKGIEAIGLLARRSRMRELRRVPRPRAGRRSRRGPGRRGRGGRRHRARGPASPTDDLGRVIGREGRVANAIRTVAKAAATARGRGRVMVEIVEDD